MKQLILEDVFVRLVAKQLMQSGSIAVSLDHANTLEACLRAWYFCKFHEWTETEYTKGMLNTKEDPSATERVGSFGEQAFSLITGLPLDKEYKKHGNKKDFVLQTKPNPILIEVKTQQREHVDGRFEGEYWVKATDRYDKKIVPLKADIYVFCLLAQWDKEKKNNAEWVHIEFVGWVTKSHFNKHLRIDRAVRRDMPHQNYYVHNRHLSSMQSFIIKYNKYLGHPRLLIS